MTPVNFQSLRFGGIRALLLRGVTLDLYDLHLSVAQFRKEAVTATVRQLV